MKLVDGDDGARTKDGDDDDSDITVEVCSGYHRPRRRFSRTGDAFSAVPLAGSYTQQLQLAKESHFSASMFNERIYKTIEEDIDKIESRRIWIGSQQWRDAHMDKHVIDQSQIKQIVALTYRIEEYLGKWLKATRSKKVEGLQG